MGGGAVKTIVLLMVLVVLSLLVGAQVSDGLKDSIGAFAVIGCVAMLFGLIVMGKNAWWLVFLLEPFLSLFPLPFLMGNLGVYALAGFIFVYNLIQSVFLRQQKLTWHKLVAFDVLFLVIAVYMCISYYRFPVFLEMLSADAEYIGAETYVHWLGAILYFFSLSCLSIKSEELEKVLRIAYWVALGVAAIQVGMRLGTGDIYWGGGGAEDGSSSSLGEALGEKRITLFAPVAYLLIPYIYASRPLLSLMCSPVRMAGMLFAICGISLAGSRGMLLAQVLHIIGISFLKREFAAVGVMGIAMCGGIGMLSVGGALDSLPRTAQRMISIIPGIQVNNDVALDATQSSDVRIVAWKMAFDVRAGYIKDYIWGDGFQLSRKEHGRHVVAVMRGTSQKIGLERGNDMLARTGNWHNGFITTMHRLGLVGCALFYLMMLLCLWLFFIVGRYYRCKPFFPYYCAYLVVVFSRPFAYSYNANTPTGFFDSFNAYILLKLLYVLLREEGKLSPYKLYRTYVPMLIQEQNDREQGNLGKAPMTFAH